MVLNSLSFCLSVKLLISPSYLNEILAGYSNLGWQEWRYSDKIDFKTKVVKRDKEGHYIMIKRSIQEEDITIINIYAPNISSVQFSHSVVSDSLRPHESQHAKPPCPSPTPGVHSDSRPSSQ